MKTRDRTIIHVPRRFVAHEWGGTETVILEISHQQQRAGWRPEIHTSSALTRERHEVIGNVPVERYGYCYPFFGLSKSERAAMDKKGGNLLSLSLFTHLLHVPEVRLFHAHALKRLGGEVRTAARWRKKPLVVSLHGGVFDVPASEMAGLIAPIKNKVEWGRPFGAFFGSRRVLEEADHVICVGESELVEARRHLPHDRISFLPNGVDAQRFCFGKGGRFRAKHAISPDAFVVLNISRIDAQKNQLLLVEAFARFRQTAPDAVLVIIGPETQPDYAARLRQRVTELGLERAVRVLPGLRNNDTDLQDAYHAGDVFVLPSLHEPFGIVVLEAWSAGKAVIASKVGGLKTLIDHQQTGLLFDPLDEDAAGQLASSLQHLHDAQHEAHRLGKAGQREAQTKYAWPAIGARLEEIYGRAEEHAAQRYGRAYL